MSGGASGAELVGRILEQLADGFAGGASELARRLGATRTIVFEAIAELELAGLVERDARGRISPGLCAGKLGYAAFGLAPIAAAAEALLPSLRNDTEALVEIVVLAEDEVVLSQRRPAGRARGAIAETIEAPIAARADARLRLRLRAGATRSEIANARQSAEAVAKALSKLTREFPEASPG